MPTDSPAPVADPGPAVEPAPVGDLAHPGRLDCIVVRPAVDARSTPPEAWLDTADGLEGDSWRARGSRHTDDGSADPACQLTLMSIRVLAAIEPDRTRWPLAGDSLLVDLDLSPESLPAGTRLAIGDAIIEVSEKPHTGCAKFGARFGSAALAWINGPDGRAARRRGLNARIVQAGRVRVGDPIVRQ